MARGETGMTARERGERDFRDGFTITRCPFPKGKERQAWIAGWYAARASA
jgi:ribosome modulation factor